MYLLDNPTPIRRYIIPFAFIVISVVAYSYEPTEPVEASEIKVSEVEIVEVQEKADSIEEIIWDKNTIKKEVWNVASEYGVSPEVMWNVMLCENEELNPKLQSYIPADGPNGREDSWGLAQFWLPAKNKTADGEVITKEMAQSPEIAIDAMAYHFSIGNAKLWSCYKMLY